MITQHLATLLENCNPPKHYHLKQKHRTKVCEEPMGRVIHGTNGRKGQAVCDVRRKVEAAPIACAEAEMAMKEAVWRVLVMNFILTDKETRNELIEEAARRTKGHKDTDDIVAAKLGCSVGLAPGSCNTAAVINTAKGE
eukprot:GHVT01067440.1.p2 GENE.GHVT01067440.1~~GHVT01067440.1.p2  ORF type:complete len:139 (+),score=16.90 GHVT01067440.1:978-1394(+)